MTNTIFASLAFCLTIGLLGFSGCSSNYENAQQRETQDAKTRQEAADTTEKAKEEAKKAAQELDKASHELAHQAKVVGQGAKEGWNRDHSQVVDLNTASAQELQSLPGLTPDDAQRIINGRPYNSTYDLVTGAIVSEAEYQQIQNRIVVKKGAQ